MEGAFCRIRQEVEGDGSRLGILRERLGFWSRYRVGVPSSVEVAQLGPSGPGASLSIADMGMSSEANSRKAESYRPCCDSDVQHNRQGRTLEECLLINR